MLPYRLLGYINDARYLTADPTPAAVKQLSPHRNHLNLRHKESSISDSDLTSFRSIPIVAEKLTVIEEELFIDYGREYMFSTTT